VSYSEADIDEVIADEKRALVLRRPHKGVGGGAAAPSSSSSFIIIVSNAFDRRHIWRRSL